MRKPSEYSSDLTNLKRELDDFMQQHDLHAIPTFSELHKANRPDLQNAIRHYGGVYVVAQKLGLPVAQTPPGYWTDFANVERELDDFMHQHGLYTLPTASLLLEADLGDLLKAVYQHGGFPLVAEQLGLPIDKTTPDHWNDFTNVEYELREFMRQHDLHTIPTRTELSKARCYSLRNAIDHYRGTALVPQKLGLPAAPKPDDYWGDFANVERELRAFIDQYDLHTLPSITQLRKAQRHDLIRPIYDHGGPQAVAEKLGLTTLKKPYHYWTDFANVERELRAFMQQHHLHTLSTATALLQAHRRDLLNAIYKHGGIYTLAEKLGLITD